LIKGPNHLDERIPIEVDGIQVNFCKNPQCPNFGVPASTKRQPRGKGSTERGRDTYNVVGSGRGTPMLRCGFCGQYPTIKSNKGIHEELIRFWKPFDTIATPTCPNQNCPNHSMDIEKGKSHYHLFGRTKAGSIRYRCKACGRTFTTTALLPTSRHRKPYKNCCHIPSSRQQGAFPSYLRGGRDSPCRLSIGRSILFIGSAFPLRLRENVIFPPCHSPASISELTGKTI